MIKVIGMLQVNESFVKDPVLSILGHFIQPRQLMVDVNVLNSDGTQVGALWYESIDLEALDNSTGNAFDFIISATENAIIQDLQESNPECTFEKI